MNLTWLLERAAWEHPDGDAVVDRDGTTTSYAELRDLSARVSDVLAREVGVGEDEVVVTLLPDDHVHVSTFYAVMRIGAVFSGLNRRATAEKLVADVERCGAVALIASAEFADVAEHLRASCPTLREVLTVDELRERCATASPERRIVSRADTDAAAVNFTAGTSGASKGVVMPHGGLCTSAMASVLHAGLTSRTRNLSVVSMFHSGGIIDCVRFVFLGGTIVWSDGWDAGRVIDLLGSGGVTSIFHIVPTMVRDLMAHPGWRTLDLSGLRTHVAGEPVPADVLEALRGRGARVGTLYGLTEAMSIVTGVALHHGDERDLPASSSGRPDRDFCEFKLADPVTGETLEGGDVEGEVCIRGGAVTPGYFNDPGRTAEAFDAEGFLHTRDVAHRDADGWVSIRGRTDDLILTGGEKLSLLEVDECLRDHPAVADAGTVGVRHERFGSVPAAFVVFLGDADEETVRDELDAWCLARIERWKRPRLYARVEEVPRTAAKRTKMSGALRALVEDVVVRDEDGVATLRALRAAS